MILGQRHLRSVPAGYAGAITATGRTRACSRNLRCARPGAGDSTARIERRQLLSGLISEYRRAA
jgi:hypothetical protein